MKKLIIFFVFISNVLLSQTHNEIIWSFVDENIGFKVGDGVCLTLIEKAYAKFTDAKLTKRETKTTAHFYFGEQVSADSVKPGDIVAFFSIDTVTKEESAHIGVLYENGVVAHQNYDTHSLKYSVVVLTPIADVVSANKSEVVSIKYYRPF